MKPQSTDKVIIDTNKDQMRIISTGSFDIVQEANNPLRTWSTSVIVKEILFANKNIVEVYTQDVEQGDTITKMNQSDKYFRLQDDGNGLLKITGYRIYGTLPDPRTTRCYYFVYSGVYE